MIADATSLQYVLHAAVGDTMTIDTGAATPVTLRFVGALRDSVLQGELVMAEGQFVRLFPSQEGYRFFLIDAPDVRTSEQARQLAEIIEKDLQPFGVDAVSTVERLDAFHRVENTYLSTFQALGGLGLLLGTIGLATVMFRNVLERRRELALLRAVGYDARHITVMIGAETLFLLLSGLAAGAGCAIVAVAPAWLARGGSGPGVGLLVLLARHRRGRDPVRRRRHARGGDRRRCWRRCGQSRIPPVRRWRWVGSTGSQKRSNGGNGENGKENIFILLPFLR